MYLLKKIIFYFQLDRLSSMALSFIKLGRVSVHLMKETQSILFQVVSLFKQVSLQNSIFRY